MNAKRILVVEDQESIRRLVQVNLERAGYNVTLALNGQEALEQFASRSFDLLIIDDDLLDIPGNKLAQRIRDSRVTSNPFVLLMVPKEKAVQPDWMSSAWNRSADCIITKPFNPEELLAFIRRLFEAK